MLPSVDRMLSVYAVVSAVVGAWILLDIQKATDFPMLLKHELDLWFSLAGFCGLAIYSYDFIPNHNTIAACAKVFSLFILSLITGVLFFARMSVTS